MQTSDAISNPTAESPVSATRGDSARLDIRSVRRVFRGNVVAVSDVNLSINPGEFVAVVGPSGSGKTTLLRMIAGLESPNSGDILVDSQSIRDRPPRLRNLALVFQDPALLPHLSVEQNIAFSLHRQELRRDEIRSRIHICSRELDINHLLNRAPAELSGGERRRVALARALVRLPRILLLDEPLSNLDGPLAIATRDLIVRIARDHALTTLLVTHDQADALAVGDRIVVMNEGRIEQIGTPVNVYLEPETRFVAGFIGDPPMNLLPCAFKSDGDRIAIRLEGIDSPIIEIDATKLPTRLDDSIRRPDSTRFDLAFRSEDVRIHLNPNSADTTIEPRVAAGFGSRAMIDAVVARLEFRGYETIAALSVGPLEIKARSTTNAQIRVGDRVQAELDLNKIHLFDRTSNLRIL